MMARSDWNFNEGVAKTFDKHVREHVPHYDEIHRMITAMSTWFAEDDSNIYDLGTSLGEVIANMSEMMPSRKANYIGLEISEEMFCKATDRFKGMNNVFIRNSDITTEDFSPTNASLVTAVLTLKAF